MKLRSSIVLLLIGIISVYSFYPTVNEQERESLIMHALLSVLNQIHLKPQAINDEFSKKAFDYYMGYIDGNKRFLTQQDIDQLKAYEMLIDNQANERSLEFFDLSVELLDQGIENARIFYEELINSDFDFSKRELFELDGEKREYAQNDEEIKQLWGDILKYEMLSKIDRKLDRQKDNETQKSLEEIKKESREEVEEIMDEWFKRIDRLRRSDRFEAYLNTFTHLFDPHSDYFNPKEKQDFDIRMGGKLEGIGARLQNDGDYVKVVTIVPGGPAWKGKELEVDDLILKVTQKGEEPVDITGMRIDDVVQMIRGKKGTVVELSVKKKDGSFVDIAIERDEVIIDEIFARSVILGKDEVLNNVGYIKLPKFYSSFEGKNGNSCALDVAKELEKLKEANVDGIILDLRNNGGGSLGDVVKMSGLFIEDGPIVQVKPRTRQAYVYEDEDPQAQYTGPLIVMVNSYSASASEILAAALQDYGRAVIVGSNSTFGKGTVQRFFDLDQFIRGGSEFKPLGQVKMTMQKFYRINGGSTQLYGVSPDVVLPDSYAFIDVGEKEYDFAMDWTSIEPVAFEQAVMKVNGLDRLQEKSAERVQLNDQFQLILENAQRLKQNSEETKVPLNLEDFISLRNQKEEEAKKYNNLFEDSVEGLSVKNLIVDMEYINSDSSRIARNDSWKENITKDIYIEETIHIMSDLLGKDKS